jgi:uncharacterized protein YqeY
MTLEFLQKEKIQAMKEKDILKIEILSSIIGAIQNAAIAKKCKDNITEELISEVLLKEKKILQEQIATCPADRIIMLANFVRKMEYLNEYCPKLINDPEEIKAIVVRELAAAGIESVKANKGVAMKMLMPQFKGKADMKIVNQVIGEILK